ncbi:hypothetical protein CBP05_25575 [Pseudomonas putida]|nr:hypothetical protein CBP05_25575 [Pseudomonas putida]
MLVRRDIEIGTKAFARESHRHNWPETNVGAGLPAKRRAGGARSTHRRRTQAGWALDLRTAAELKPDRRSLHPPKKSR